MMRYILLSVFIMLSLFTQAQTNLDSLYTVWEDETQSDSLRAKAFYDYMFYGFFYNDLDSAITLSNELYAFGQANQSHFAIALAENIKGGGYYMKSDFPNALIHYKESLQNNELIGNRRGVASSLNNIGNVFESLGNYPQALSYYQKSLKIKEEIGNQRGIAFSLSNIGLIHEHLGETQEALEYYERSLEVSEDIDDKQAVAISLQGIGHIYENQSKYSLALDHYERSLTICEEIENDQEIAFSLSGIGSVYYQQSKYTLALIYFKRSKDIFEKIGTRNGVSSALNNFGNIYNEQGLYHDAIVNCKKSLKINEEIGDILRQKNSCACLYRAYKELGNYTKALKYFEQLAVLKDSLFNEENTKKLTQLEMQFEFDKKEAAALLEQEKKNAIAAQEIKQRKLERNGFIAGFGVVLLFASIFFRQRNRINKEKERSDGLLLNILPEEVAEELKKNGHSDAQFIDHVTVLFTDFKDFTKLSEQLSPNELVADLHQCFSHFDRICENSNVEKIKTIGDAYMAAGGLPFPNKTHARDVVNASLKMTKIIEQIKAEKLAANEPFFEVRIGVHTGPVVAGIVGVKKFQYDIWGDTVNTASRIETNGEAGKVNVSNATYELLKDDPDFCFEYRGKIEAKGKGEMDMWFVSKNNDS